MPALFAVVSSWLSEEPATQLQEIQDTQHAPSVSQYLCWLSTTLVVIVVSASPLSYLHWLWLSLLLLQKLLETVLYRTVNKQQTSNQMQFGGGTLPFDYGDNIHLHCNAINHWHWIFVLVIIFYFIFSNLKECGDKIACLLLRKKQRWQREAIAIVFLMLKTLWIDGKCLGSY